jgi:hypothetical protein
MRRLLAVALAAVGCTALPQEEPPDCVALFEQYDRIERYGPQPNLNMRFDPVMLPARLERQTHALQRAGCVTRPQDLDGMEALAGQLAGFRIESGGAEIRAVPVHVGVVQGFVDERRATVFFRGLGSRSRGIGAAGLGRRIYIGPFTSEAALEQAIAVAREAGFVAPYAATQTKF